MDRQDGASRCHLCSPPGADFAKESLIWSNDAVIDERRSLSHSGHHSFVHGVPASFSQRPSRSPKPMHLTIGSTTGRFTAVRPPRPRPETKRARRSRRSPLRIRPPERPLRRPLSEHANRIRRSRRLDNRHSRRIRRCSRNRRRGTPRRRQRIRRLYRHTGRLDTSPAPEQRPLDQQTSHRRHRTALIRSPPNQIHKRLRRDPNMDRPERSGHETEPNRRSTLGQHRIQPDRLDPPCA